MVQEFCDLALDWSQDRYAPAPFPRGKPLNLDPPIKPEIVGGVWCARCPYCGELSPFSWNGGARWYCLNLACPRPHGGRWLRVSRPGGGAMRASWLLVHRVKPVYDQRTGHAVDVNGEPLMQPDVANRNWTSTSTGAEVVAENEALGARVTPTPDDWRPDSLITLAYRASMPLSDWPAAEDRG